MDAGNQALGRLDGITLLLPDPDQFLYTFIRKEAVLSSQIEGTQSSLSDLLLFEHEAAPGVAREDAQVTANYIAAMNHGITEILRPGGTGPSARACSGTCTRFFWRRDADPSRLPASFAEIRTGSAAAGRGTRASSRLRGRRSRRR